MEACAVHALPPSSPPAHRIESLRLPSRRPAPSLPTCPVNAPRECSVFPRKPPPRANHRVKTDRVVCFGFTLHSHHIIPTPTPYHLYTCAVPGSYLRRCTLGFRGKIRGCSGAGTTLVRRRYEVDPSFTLCCTGFGGEGAFAGIGPIWRFGKDVLPLPYRLVGMFFGLQDK